MTIFQCLPRDLLLVAIPLLLLTAGNAAQAAIAFRQTANAVPQSSQTTVSVVFGTAQVAGNLNVVAVGWFNTTAHILSVTDTRGNAYV
ncbi:MAG TPA: hypothetical protein VEZ88_11540, partial [Steroidobacteraceae bacterium]|nr:hypothetical protein [Steroidobacteraceae bacterium]